MSTIAENLGRAEKAIQDACRAAGRPRSDVELMAVSKMHPVECLFEAAEAGQCVFGENRVQEFAAKHDALAAQNYQVERQHAQDLSQQTGHLRIHLIGHLQSNKAARAAELFSCVDTLDSVKLAQRLHEAAAAMGRVLPVLIEIKLSDEPTKEGLSPDSAELALLLERLPDLDRLAPRGLMTVAPLDSDPERARTCFRTLRKLRDSLGQQHNRLSLDELSMGMSGDYCLAIEEGSTQIRLGTAIFGARPHNRQPGTPT